jgi:hypothetical protein
MQSILPCNGCGSTCGLLTAATGTFSDGSGSSNYANSATCQWIIAPAGASNVSLAFTEFSTEGCCDFVRVYTCMNVSCQGAQLVAELSGLYSTVQTVTSMSGYVLVQFLSDYEGNQPGFTATWNIMGTSGVS